MRNAKEKGDDEGTVVEGKKKDERGGMFYIVKQSHTN